MAMTTGGSVQDARWASGGASGPSGAGGAGRRLHAAAVGAVVLVGAVLRALHLDQPVRYDEAVTYLEYVSRPLAEALGSYGLPNNHLFHTLLAHLSVDLLGDSIVALRLPAWTAGTLVVPGTYLAGRVVRGPRAGLLAAALAAVSPALVLFSANARGYSMVVLAFLAMILAAAILMRRWSPPAWAGFVAAAALGAWTVPVMLYPAVAAAAWWVAGTASGERRTVVVLGEAAAAGLAAAALTALLYLPVLREAGLEALTANRFVVPRAPAVFAAAVPGFLADVVREWAHGVPVWASALVAAGAAAELVAWLRARQGFPPPVLPTAVAASLLVLAATRRTPFVRVWLFLLPALLIFAGAGLARVAEDAESRIRGARGGASRVAGGSLAVPLLALAVALPVGWSVWNGGAVRGWGLTGSLPSGDVVAGFLAERWERGDAVRAKIPSDAPLEFYFRRRGLPPSAVNGAAAPGGCVYVVVNRRHGQTLAEVAGVGRRGAPSPPRPLRDWGETAVYGLPLRGGAGGEEEADGACRS